MNMDLVELKLSGMSITGVSLMQVATFAVKNQSLLKLDISWLQSSGRDIEKAMA
jgi:hypothetical protein